MTPTLLLLGERIGVIRDAYREDTRMAPFHSMEEVMNGIDRDLQKLGGFRKGRIKVKGSDLLLGKI
jgi:hypothetical protein